MAITIPIVTTILPLIISDNRYGDRGLLLLMGRERTKPRLCPSLSGCSILRTMAILEKVSACVGQLLLEASL